MWLLIGTIAITFLSVYLSMRFGEDHPLFNTFLFIIVCGFLLIPSFIIFEILEHYDAVQEYKVIPITLPLLMLGFFAVWATWGTSKDGGNTKNKKDDFTSEAIILTTVLSEDDDVKDSNHSNSSGSSSSSSNSNSDDFFLL